MALNVLLHGDNGMLCSDIWCGCEVEVSGLLLEEHTVDGNICLQLADSPITVLGRLTSSPSSSVPVIPSHSIIHTNPYTPPYNSRTTTATLTYTHAQWRTISRKITTAFSITLSTDNITQTNTTHIRHRLHKHILTQNATFKHWDNHAYTITHVKPSNAQYFYVNAHTNITIQYNNNNKDVQLHDIPRQTPAHLAHLAYVLNPLINYFRQMLFFKTHKTLADNFPANLLIFGASGCGKTLAVRTIAEQFQIELVYLSGNFVHAQNSYGSSVHMVKEAFQKVNSVCSTDNRPCILFLDDLDSLCPKRSDQARSSKVLVQILTFLDGVRSNLNGGRQLIVIGASNKPNNIDPALRRPGRLDREYEIPNPDSHSRGLILSHLLGQRFTSREFDYGKFGQRMVGFVGSDIAELVHSLNLGNESLETHKLEYAIDHFIPASRRSHSVDFRKIRWDDIGGLENVKSKLKLLTEKTGSFEKLGIALTKGILLYGAPGCSKTSLVKALASSISESASFLSSDGASIYSSYFGEAEANIRQLFVRARANAPCVLFLDEIDSIVTNRDTNQGGSGVQNRVLSTLLNEMDGVQSTKECPVLVVAATNYPEKLDSALLRPGRFDHLFYVPPPDFEARKAILELYLRNARFADDIDLSEIALSLENYSGADLESLAREAWMTAIRENRKEITLEHFQIAMFSIPPSLDTELLERYKLFERANSKSNRRKSL